MHAENTLTHFLIGVKSHIAYAGHKLKLLAFSLYSYYKCQLWDKILISTTSKLKTKEEIWMIFLPLDASCQSFAIRNYLQTLNSCKIYFYQVGFFEILDMLFSIKFCTRGWGTIL